MAINPTSLADPTPKVDTGTETVMPVVSVTTELPQIIVDDPYTATFNTEAVSNELDRENLNRFRESLIPLYGFGDADLQVPVDVDDSTALNRFMYGWGKGKSMIGNLYVASQAAYNTPEYHNGTIMTTSEKFGLTDDQWDNMLYKDKIKLVKDADDAELREKYPKAAAAFDSGNAGFAGNLSEFIAMLGVESLIAFPASITRSALKTAAASGAFGSAYSLSEDLGNGRDIDYTRAATIGAGSAVLGGAIVKGTQVLKKRKQKKIEEFKIENDDKVIGEANLAAAMAKREGLSKDEVPKITSERFGHTPEAVNEAKKRSGARVVMPSSKAEAELIIKSAADAAEGKFSSKSKTRKLAERMFVPILSRIENISPAVAMSMNKLEMNRHTKLFNYLSGERDRKVLARAKNIKKEDVEIGAGDFVTTLGKLDDNDKFLVFAAARKGDDAGVAKILSKKVGVEKAAIQMKQARSIINKVGDDLVEIGLLKQKSRMKGYFPSHVKDVNGLMQALGKDKRVGQQQVQGWVRQFAKETGLEHYNQLPPESIAEFLNKVATGQVVGIRGGKLSYTSKRTMESVPREYYKYYASLEDSVYDFITKGIDVSEQGKFLGLNNIVKKTKKDGSEIDDQIDVAASLTQKLNREAPALASDAQEEIVSMLSSRFGKGQETPSEIVRLLRDIGYAFTLANPFSALIQLSDVGLSMWVNGTINTLKGVLSKKEFDMLEFGLADTVSAIAVNPKDLSATLNTFMRVSGFQKLDRVGKNIYMNAAWKRVQKQAQTKEGLEKLSKKYRVAYGDEYDSLISAVKAGNTADENVRLMMWQELSDAQPISLSKTPQSSLNVPDGRIFYALKMFALNQLNLVGRQTFKKIRSKNPAERAEGYKMTLMLLPTVAFMGAAVTDLRKYLKNGMEGFEPEDFPASMGEHMLKMVGASYWTIDQIEKGNVGQAVSSYVSIPAFGVFMDAIEGGSEVINGGVTTDNTFLKRLPVVGSLMDVLTNDPASALREEKLKNI